MNIKINSHRWQSSQFLNSTIICSNRRKSQRPLKCTRFRCCFQFVHSNNREILSKTKKAIPFQLFKVQQQNKDRKKKTPVNFVNCLTTQQLNRFWKFFHTTLKKHLLVFRFYYCKCGTLVGRLFSLVFLCCLSVCLFVNVSIFIFLKKKSTDNNLGFSFSPDSTITPFNALIDDVLKKKSCVRGFTFHQIKTISK